MKVPKIKWKFFVSTMAHLNFSQSCKHTSLTLKLKHKIYVQESSNTIIKHQWFNYCTIIFNIYSVQVIKRIWKFTECSCNTTSEKFRNVVMEWSEKLWDTCYWFTKKLNLETKFLNFKRWTKSHQHWKLQKRRFQKSGFLFQKLLTI